MHTCSSMTGLELCLSAAHWKLGSISTYGFCFDNKLLLKDSWSTSLSCYKKMAKRKTKPTQLTGEGTGQVLTPSVHTPSPI